MYKSKVTLAFSAKKFKIFNEYAKSVNLLLIVRRSVVSQNDPISVSQSMIHWFSWILMKAIQFQSNWCWFWKFKKKRVLDASNQKKDSFTMRKKTANKLKRKIQIEREMVFHSTFFHVSRRELIGVCVCNIANALHWDYLLCLKQSGSLCKLKRNFSFRMQYILCNVVKTYAQSHS